MSEFSLYQNYFFSEPTNVSDEYAFFNRYEKFQLHDRASPEFVIFRCLLGGVFFESSENERILFDTNFFVYPTKKTNLKSGSFWHDVELVLDPYKLSIKSFMDVFHSQSQSNKSFFESLLVEMALAISAHKKAEGLKSFLHIYRALEHISYAIPLIYLKSQDNYQKTYDSFKKFFGGAKSEVGFGRNFIKKIMIDTLYETPCVIDFSNQPEQNFKAVKFAFQDEKEYRDFDFDDSRELVTFPFGRTFDFITQLRNMYFHFLYSKDYSIHSKDLVSPEIFFNGINDVCISFISNFYLILYNDRYG